MNNKLILQRIKNIFKVSGRKYLIGILVILFVFSFLYPSDLAYYQSKEKSKSVIVNMVEHQIRYINTISQALLPIILWDKIGAMQAIYVGIGTTIGVHSLKAIYNNIYIKDTRLGQRPWREDSKHNVPSGHSAMASSAMAFVAIRYGYKHLFYLLPITLLTMLTRIALKAHTFSAVTSGAILGIIIALLFASKYKK